MIERIEGELEAVDGDVAVITPAGGLTYRVLLPAHTAARLTASTGQTVRLHTLHYLDSQSQGATMTPRLAGFTSAKDRAFFELFVTCKGIGYRKALRAMAMAPAQIAAAIADRDTATLQSLPEIGRRTAESIVVTLKDQVNEFLAAAESRQPAAAGAALSEGERAGRGGGTLARDALEVLVQLGENRVQARTWIDRALSQDEPPGDVESLIAEVYRIKSGA